MIKKLYFNVFGPEDNNTEEDQNSFSLNYNTETKEFYAVDTTVAEEPASDDPSEPVAAPVVNQLSFGTLDTEGGVPNVILSGGTNIEIVDDFINCTLTGVSQLTNDTGYITSGAINSLISGINTNRNNISIISSQLQNINNNPSGGYDNNALSAVSAQVTTNKSNIATLSANLATSGMNIRTLSTRVNTISSDITNLNNQVADINNQLQNYNGNINISGYSLSSNYLGNLVGENGVVVTNNSGYVFGIDENWLKNFNTSWIQDNSANGGANAVKNVTSTATFNSKINILSSNLNTISSRLSGINNNPSGVASGAVSYDDTQLRNQISTISSNYAKTVTVNGVVSSVSTLSANLQSLSSQVQNITINPSGNIDNSALSTIYAQVETNTSNISTISSRIGIVSSDLTSTKITLSTTNSKVNTLSTQFTAIRNDVNTISANLGNNSGNNTINEAENIEFLRNHLSGMNGISGAAWDSNSGYIFSLDEQWLKGFNKSWANDTGISGGFNTIKTIANTDNLSSRINTVSTNINVLSANLATAKTNIATISTNYAKKNDIPSGVSELTNDAGYITSAQLPDFSGYATTSSVSALNTNLTTLSTTVADVDFKVDTVSTTLDSYNFIVENNWIVLPISASVTVQNNRRYICRAPSGNNNFIRLNCPTTAQGLVDGFKFGLFIESLLSQGAIKIRDKNHPIILGNQVVEWVSQDDGGNEDEFELNQALTYAEFVFTASDNSWHCINLSLPAGQYVNVGEVLLETLQNSPNFKQQLRQELGLVN